MTDQPQDQTPLEAAFADAASLEAMVEEAMDGINVRNPEDVSHAVQATTWALYMTDAGPVQQSLLDEFAWYARVYNGELTGEDLDQAPEARAVRHERWEQFIDRASELFAAWATTKGVTLKILVPMKCHGGFDPYTLSPRGLSAGWEDEA